MEGDKESDSSQEMNAKTSSPTENLPKERLVEMKSKRTRDEKRERKKDDKSVEHVLKALNSLETTEEKLAAMCQKYADMFNNHRMLQNAAKQAEKRCSILQREKEQLQADQSKAILTRSRLENLCRELQRQNKAVKEESMMRIREEEEKRKEVSAKFQATLTEITNMMQLNNDNNTKLRDDNLDMNAKLRDFCQQYDKREQQVQKLVNEMQLEMQLADAKLAKAKMEMAHEMEILLREKQQLLSEIAGYKAQMHEMESTEQTLRNQITVYSSKYDEFHRALMQSNQAIDGFKAEMERLSKQIRKLEKETSSWKNRYEQTRGSLLRMTEDKIKSDQELGVLHRKLSALQNLCRTLQAEVVQLRGQVKSASGATPLQSDDVNGSGGDIASSSMEDKLSAVMASDEKIEGEVNGMLEEEVKKRFEKAMEEMERVVQEAENKDGTSEEAQIDSTIEDGVKSFEVNEEVEKDKLKEKVEDIVSTKEKTDVNVDKKKDNVKGNVEEKEAQKEVVEQEVLVENVECGEEKKVNMEMEVQKIEALNEVEKPAVNEENQRVDQVKEDINTNTEEKKPDVIEERQTNVKDEENIHDLEETTQKPNILKQCDNKLQVEVEKLEKCETEVVGQVSEDGTENKLEGNDSNGLATSRLSSEEMKDVKVELKDNLKTETEIVPGNNEQEIKDETSEDMSKKSKSPKEAGKKQSAKKRSKQNKS